MSDLDDGKATKDTDNPLADMPVWKVLTYIGLQAVAFISVGVALWIFSGRAAASFVAYAAWEVGAGLALAFALIAVSFVLSRAFPKWVEWLVHSQARNYPFLKHRISISAIIFISLCAGFGEEVLFRGGLQTLLGDYVSLSFAVLIASALFALIHFAQPFNSALIFIIGCLFGVVYWATGSLLTVIIAHTVYDIYALWTLQEAMHEFGVFDDEEAESLPGEPERETMPQSQKP
ncbi:MAG: type II CAAX endopeptidase family protein [Pseudomonadota bacterium]